MRDFLFLATGRAVVGAYHYVREKLQRLLIPVAPIENVQWGMVGRLQQFGDGLVYRLSWRNAPAESLCVLTDFEKGAVLVDCFRDKQVRDIVVRDDKCLVLIANRQPIAEGKFTGSIYSVRRPQVLDALG